MSRCANNVWTPPGDRQLGGAHQVMSLRIITWVV